MRDAYFDLGSVTDCHVTPSHIVGAAEAVWPDTATAPTFSWTDNTVGLRVFLLDISTNPPDAPVHSPSTITLGGAKGVGTPSYTLTAAQWRRVKSLASHAGGALYWKVRALDSDRVLLAGSAITPLIIDGGAWDVSALDLSADSPAVSWTHDSQGPERFTLEISVDAAFPVTGGRTTRFASRTLGAASYTLTAAEKKRVLDLAARRGAAALYYRVSAADADKAFITLSPSQTAPLP